MLLAVANSCRNTHQLQRWASTAPLWHRIVPVKKWRERLADRKKPAVAVLTLNGVIAKEGRKPLNLAILRPQIEKAFDTPRLECVLLSINSPGGSPAQSELISDYIQLLAREKNVKVYSFVEDVAASGGYWLACAGEKIFVTANSVLGSIGVIFASFGFPEAIKHLNIERRVLTAGQKKLISDPFSPVKEADQQIMKRVLEHIHNNFKDHVTRNRGSRVAAQGDAIFTGEFWVGREAVQMGLADGLETIDTFVRKEFGGPKAIRLVRIKGQVNLLQQMLGVDMDLPPLGGTLGGHPLHQLPRALLASDLLPRV